ncbi:putative ribonuclease toxin of YeeF-YezG toxin-antitoxin module [Bacillus sp. V2I10]|nr:putative ribonuclease toxin of YeeF-YezG toxin-antitoxin module [Bacillus sp. V2I10]
MATAGMVPVVGWAGRAFKGGTDNYKTYNAADSGLDANKTSKSFSTLQKTEMGIYGLVSANGLGEAVLLKDMMMLLVKRSFMMMLIMHLVDY